MSCLLGFRRAFRILHSYTELELAFPQTQRGKCKQLCAYCDKPLTEKTHKELLKRLYVKVICNKVFIDKTLQEIVHLNPHRKMEHL